MHNGDRHTWMLAQSPHQVEEAEWKPLKLLSLSQREQVKTILHPEEEEGRHLNHLKDPKDAMMVVLFLSLLICQSNLGDENNMSPQ